MELYFRNKVAELRITYLEFFETAYMWRFGKLVCIEADYCQFLLHSIIPKYAVAYCQHLMEMENERSRHVQPVQQGCHERPCDPVQQAAHWDAVDDTGTLLDQRQMS